MRIAENTPFGEYHLIKLLGKGGMAEVYLAQSQGVDGFQKQLALKIIHPSLSYDQEFVQMLIDEAKLSAQLNHPNIVHVHDLKCHEGIYYITMEFIDGCDVYQALVKSESRQQNFPIEVAAWITHEVCAGLSYAHARKTSTGHALNIIHRDISPQNIQLSREGEVKIVDFGIAKAEQRSSQTQHGVIKGKYSYMSPEQAWGDQIDQRTDLFSLGICLFEMLAGEVLYDAEEGLGLLEQVRLAQIPNLSQIRPDIPPELQNITYRALAADPVQRYQTAEEMRSALAHFLFSLGITSGRHLLMNFMGNLLGDQSHSVLHHSSTQAQPANLLNLATESVPMSHMVEESGAFVEQDKTKAISASMFGSVVSSGPEMNEGATRAMSNATLAQLFSPTAAAPAPVPDLAVEAAQSNAPLGQFTQPLDRENRSGALVSPSEQNRAPKQASVTPPTHPQFYSSHQSSSLGSGHQNPHMYETFENQDKTRALSATNLSGLLSQTAQTPEASLFPSNAGRSQPLPAFAPQEDEKTRALSLAQVQQQAMSPRPQETTKQAGRPQRPSVDMSTHATARFPDPTPRREVVEPTNVSKPPTSSSSFPDPTPRASVDYDIDELEELSDVQPLSPALPEALNVASDRIELSDIMAEPQGEGAAKPLVLDGAPVAEKQVVRSRKQEVRSRKEDRRKQKKKSPQTSGRRKRRANPARFVMVAAMVLLLGIGGYALIVQLSKPQAPQRYLLSVSANATGARVYLDGQDTGLRTPALLQGLKPNVEYLIKLNAQGYETQESPFIAREDRLIKEGGTLEMRMFLEAAKGTLHVFSKPSNAAVFMGDQYLGRTPLHKPNLKRDQGDIRLRFNRKGCRTTSKIFSWGDRIEEEIEVTLRCKR